MSYFVVEKKIEKLKTVLNESSDFSSRLFVGSNQKIGLVFLKSIIDQNLLSEAIYQPLQLFDKPFSIENLKEKVLKTGEVEEIDNEQVVDKILNGRVVVFTNFSDKILAIDILSFPTRVPSEPPTSPVIQGPREGFVEDIQTNITLIRRRLKTDKLVIKQLKVGSYSQTNIVVTYLKGVARDSLVQKVIEKLNRIDADGILDSYYILSYLEERPHSIFKQIGNSEKPDIVTSKLLEGKVAIIVDNSPIVLTLPFAVIEDLHNSNDYYTNHHYSSMLRVIRLFGLLVAIIVPGLYLSLQIYHYNILPINFLITIADTTKGLPFTPFLEILFIFLLFQILYEVSLRLPSYLGLATSIVGALILGDTGVKAGLISPPGVIIIALSKIALYTIPEQAAQITLMQLIFIILGGSLGILGVLSGIIYFVMYLNTLDSYDTPYLVPYSPRIQKDLKDGILTSTTKELDGVPLSFSGGEKKENKNEQ